MAEAHLEGSKDSENLLSGMSPWRFFEPSRLQREWHHATRFLKEAKQIPTPECLPEECKKAITQK